MLDKRPDKRREKKMKKKYKRLFPLYSNTKMDNYYGIRNENGAREHATQCIFNSLV